MSDSQPQPNKTIDSELESIWNEIRAASPYDYLPKSYGSMAAIPSDKWDKAFRKMKRENLKMLKAYIAQEANKARLNEAFLIGVKYEKGEYKPASYLIDRRVELTADKEKA